MKLHLLYDYSTTSIENAAELKYGRDENIPTDYTSPETKELYTLFPNTCIELIQAKITEEMERLPSVIQDVMTSLFFDFHFGEIITSPTMDAKEREAHYEKVIAAWKDGKSIIPIPEQLLYAAEGEKVYRLLTPYDYQPIPQPLLDEVIELFQNLFCNKAPNTPNDYWHESLLELHVRTKEIFRKYATETASKILETPPGTPPSKIYVTHHKIWNKVVYIKYLKLKIEEIRKLSFPHFYMEQFLIQEIKLRSLEPISYLECSDEVRNNIYNNANKIAEKNEKLFQKIIDSREKIIWLSTYSNLARVYQILIDTNCITDIPKDVFISHFLTPQTNRESDTPKASKELIEWKLKPADLIYLFGRMGDNHLIDYQDVNPYLILHKHFKPTDKREYVKGTLRKASQRLKNKERTFPSFFFRDVLIPIMNL